MFVLQCSFCNNSALVSKAGKKHARTQKDVV